MLLILFVVFNIKLGEMISVSASVLFEHFQHIIYNTIYNTVNRDNLSHYNRDLKFSYRYISTLE